jgi:hypothetical protein
MVHVRRNHVDDGKLEFIIEDFEVAKFPNCAVFPPTRTPIAKTRAFVDVLARGAGARAVKQPAAAFREFARGCRSIRWRQD